MIIKYFKGEPNTDVIRYRGGRVAQHGPGLAFWYLPFDTSIAVVATVTQLAQRLIDAIQANTRAHVIALALEEALTRVRDLAANVLENVRQEAVLNLLGVAIEGLHFTSVAATPEMKKALEAEHREALQ